MTSRRRVAVVGCREFAELDEDWPVLRAELGARGVESVFAAWDDQGVDWAEFNLILIRATWDCVTRPEDYLAWAERAATTSALHNPVDVLRWNMDKRYLADLADDGVQIVPTTWIGPLDKWEPPPGEFVIKPSVSGGGIDTARYGPTHHSEATAHVQRLQRQGRTVMVQAYVSSVDADGETALVFMGGEYSHAVKKMALLTLGDGVISRLWEREVVSPTSPTPSQMLLARDAFENVCRRFGTVPLYCRVDVLDGFEEAPVVLEVELIDPMLFLRLASGSEQRFADAVVRTMLI